MQVLSGAVKTFVWVIRGTPLMLQIIVIYLGPGLLGMNNPWPSGSGGRMVAAVVAFAINYACYFSEIYRGGIEAVPKGQTEAGQVLGMTKTQIFFKVTLLQVVKRILPPMGNEIITLVKDTSLANTIANKEIIMMAKEYSAKGLIWPLFSTALFFLCSWAHSRCCSAGPKETGLFPLLRRWKIWHYWKPPASGKISERQRSKGYFTDLEQGEALAIIGSSGSGKTTLLRCLNFLERPDTGVIKVNGETMWDAADPATQRESEIRKKRLHFGLVFQNFNLFPQYTALQNVMLAGELLARSARTTRPTKRPSTPSWNSRQRNCWRRWACRSGQATTRTSSPAASSSAWPLPARWRCTRTSSALTSPPRALDPELTGEVLRVLRDLADRKTTMIIVTHEMHFARDVADRILFMDGGVVVEEGPAKAADRPPAGRAHQQFLAHYAKKWKC